MELVQGRKCGECSACCTVLDVDTPEFQKLPGKPCSHLCKDGGCSIHETRFPICRSYHCGWRYLPGLGEDWRPDKMGVLVDFWTGEVPAHLPGRPAISLTVFGNRKTALTPVFLYYVAQLVAAEVPVFLGMPGPAGSQHTALLLNDFMIAAVLGRDLAGMKSVMAEALKTLATHTFKPVVHRHGNIEERSTTPAK